MSRTSPSVANAALPSGSAAGRGHASPVANAALPSGSAAGRGHASPVANPALPSGRAAGRGHASPVERSWVIGACALLVYVVCASPYIVDGDGAEFATLGALGGRAHPSGYPLYVLWLRLWSWLPVATPAHASALATAILGALTIGVLHAAVRAWGARPLAATISAAIAGAAPLIVRYHSQTEVFALNNLVVVLVVWLAAEAGPLRGAWRGFALGLVAGAGLANNLTCVLVAPIGVLGVVRGVRASRATTYAWTLGGLVVGLVPYLYVWLADGIAAWGVVASPADLVAHVLRSEYGGMGKLQLHGADVAWTTSVAAWASSLLHAWLWLPALAGVAMFGARIWRPVGETRAAWALLAASFALAGPVLAARFNIDPHGVGRYICQRFHLASIVLLAIPVGAALDLVTARAARTTALTAIALVGFVALGLANLPRLAGLHSPAVERGVGHLLASVPPMAIVVVTGDDQCFGASYLQRARGVRPDVSVVCSGLVLSPWYRAQWARHGVDFPPATGASLAAALLATARPVFVDPSLQRVLAAYPSYPYGVAMRVLPPNMRPPRASDIAALNRDLYRDFDLDYPRPSRDDGYAATAHDRYAAAWAAIAQRLDREGDRGAAVDAFELTRALQPLD